MAVSVSARRVSATLVSGSLAGYETRTVRYDWTEYVIGVSWIRPQDGAPETETQIAAMTLDDAKVEARNAQAALVEKTKMARKITLKCVARTCTIRTSYEQDLHEDGDGTPIETRAIVAGKDWDYRAARAIGLEVHDAFRAIS